MSNKLINQNVPDNKSSKSCGSRNIVSNPQRKVWLKSLFFLTASTFILCITSCKKLIEVDSPGNSLNAANVYSNDMTAIAVLTGALTKISNLQIDLKSNTLTSVSLFAALSADELTLFNLNDAQLVDYYRNNLSATPNTSTFLWNAVYDHIYTVNGAIEGLSLSTSLTAAVKQRLIGEAKFIRAFCYFYLTNLYGNVPLILTTNWQTNARASSASQADVYSQVILDLKDAQELLSDEYLASDLLSTTGERTRPNKWVAKALLARTYLYAKEWANSESEANEIINNNNLYDTVSVNGGIFLKNSKETIWALQPVRTGVESNTGEGALYILPATGPNTSNFPVYLSNHIVNNFELGDLRKSYWIDSVKPSTDAFYFARKYRIDRVNTNTQEYNIVFRLAEIYLIRAEARAQQNNLTGAIADLDVTRKRAGLPLIANTNPSIPQSALLAAILHERQVELFTEWGHRWMDLKRTNNIDAVMSNVATQKGGTWNSYKALYPIPYNEIQLNTNLTQNTGY